MSGGGHTNMQLYSVFLYVLQGVAKHMKQLLLAGQLILTTLWVLSITQEVCPINFTVYQCCGNYSLQIINYNCHYLATLRTNYHCHYSDITSN